MKLHSPDDFDALLAESLRTDGPGESGCRLSSDTEFLANLNQRLDQVTSPPALTPFWIDGIFRGIAAAAAGIILFAGLNVIPPLLFQASVNGAGMVREKIIDVSVQQEIAWHQLVSAVQPR